MSVRRSKLGAGQDEPARLHLGRVLVTIDDLGALRDRLEVQGESPGEIRMEFDGGEIDGPDDLRNLTDKELLRLIVKTPKVEVVLDSTQAVAIGDRELADAVVNWAGKCNQPSRAPGPSLGNRLLRKWWVMTVLTPSLAVAVGLVVQDGGANWFPWIVLGWHAVPVVLFTRILVIGSAPISYAVIDPRTHDDIRKDSPTMIRHRATVIATAVGIACSAVVAFTLKFLD